VLGLTGHVSANEMQTNGRSFVLLALMLLSCKSLFSVERIVNVTLFVICFYVALAFFGVDLGLIVLGLGGTLVSAAIVGSSTVGSMYLQVCHGLRVDRCVGLS
jgi:small-conductance mechanosensitive channel